MTLTYVDEDTKLKQGFRKGIESLVLDFSFIVLTKIVATNEDFKDLKAFVYINVIGFLGNDDVVN